MTEERADYDAGTPGPIDPRDGDALGRMVYENFTTQPGTIGEPASWDETARWPDERVPWINSGLAVANAVCPEHHDVFDMRTHVAVPVADLTTLIKGVMDFADLESEDAAIRILNLLPTESETAEDYRKAAQKYRDDANAMRYQQQQARQAGHGQQAERFNLGIDAMDAAAETHLALANEAERRGM